MNLHLIIIERNLARVLHSILIVWEDAFKAPQLPQLHALSSVLKCDPPLRHTYWEEGTLHDSYLLMAS